MPTWDLRAETHWIALGILLVAGGIDSLLAWFGGNRSTLSAVFLDLEGHRASVCLLFAYAAGVLCWHLSIPTTDPLPELWLAVLKAVVVCIPILFVFVEIAITGDNSVLRPIAYNNQRLFALLVAGTLLGWAAARWGVSQHLAA